MDHSASFLDNTGAILLLLWAIGMWTAVAVLAVAGRRRVHPRLYTASAGVIILGVLGQIGMGQVDTSKHSLGMEILHFTGNLIFLAGMVGIMLITRHALRTRARTWAKMGTWMQGIHGIEHGVLTLSVALSAKQAIGLSTWFGLLDPGPGLSTYRIWWHMLANLVGTVIFAIALYHLRRERHLVRASFEAEAEGGGSPREGGYSPAEDTRAALEHESAPLVTTQRSSG